MALGIGWFVFLWGLNLPALLAGIALGTLLLLLRRLYRQTTLVRRETALRCRIGGELLLEKMLLSEAKEAHFQAALLLEEKWPLRMQRITADGALCRQEKPSGGAETLLPQIIEAGTLRPAAQVFTTEELRPAEGLNAYLNAHGGSVTVGDVTAALARSETVALPEVGADGE